MKKVRKILPVMVLALMVGMLSACGGTDVETPEPSSPSPTMDTPVDDVAERSLVYNDHELEIYSSVVITHGERASADPASASIAFSYQLVNNMPATGDAPDPMGGTAPDGGILIVVSSMKINGIECDPGQYTDSYTMAVFPGDDIMDEPESQLGMNAGGCQLPTEQNQQDEYEIDRGITYQVSGLFDITVKEGADWNLVDTGSFTFTIPANFPDDTYRTDEVWTSTK
jgi:hypothetical protein